MKRLNKKTLLLLIAIAALMTASVGGTVAWLVTSSGPIVNTFEPTEVKVSVADEIVDNTKKNVVITNNSDISVYIRVAVVANWYEGEDANKKIVAPWTNNLTVNSGWTLKDGYYYYNSAVAVSGWVTLFDSYTATVPEDHPNAHLEMDIIAQAIQADGGAVTSATDWSNITN